MPRYSLIAAFLICLGIAVGGRAVPAHASSLDNHQWTATLTGPSMAIVGTPITYTLSIKNDQSLAIGLNPPFSIAIAAGAANISVTATGCAGSLSAVVGPAIYTSCPTLPSYLIPGNGIVTYQITLTPTAANPAFAVTYTDPTGPQISQLTNVVAVVKPANANGNTDPPPASGPYVPPLHYNGNAYDPCYQSDGCPYGPI